MASCYLASPFEPVLWPRAASVAEWASDVPQRVRSGYAGTTEVFGTSGETPVGEALGPDTLLARWYPRAAAIPRPCLTSAEAMVWLVLCRRLAHVADLLRATARK